MINPALYSGAFLPTETLPVPATAPDTLGTFLYGYYAEDQPLNINGPYGMPSKLVHRGAANNSTNDYGDAVDLITPLTQRGIPGGTIISVHAMIGTSFQPSGTYKFQVGTPLDPRSVAVTITGRRTGTNSSADTCICVLAADRLEIGIDGTTGCWYVYDGTHKGVSTIPATCEPQSVTIRSEFTGTGVTIAATGGYSTPQSLATVVPSAKRNDNNDKTLLLFVNVSGSKRANGYGLYAMTFHSIETEANLLAVRNWATATYNIPISLDGSLFLSGHSFPAGGVAIGAQTITMGVSLALPRIRVVPVGVAGTKGVDYAPVSAGGNGNNYQSLALGTALRGGIALGKPCAELCQMGTNEVADKTNLQTGAGLRSLLEGSATVARASGLRYIHAGVLPAYDYANWGSSDWSAAEVTRAAINAQMRLSLAAGSIDGFIDPDRNYKWQPVQSDAGLIDFTSEHIYRTYRRDASPTKTAYLDAFDTAATGGRFKDGVHLGLGALEYGYELGLYVGTMMGWNTSVRYIPI